MSQVTHRQRERCVHIDMSNVSTDVPHRFAWSCTGTILVLLCVAIPDLAAMPEKYQGFIQSSIRQVFIDIPSISRLTKEINSLKFQVNTLSKENEVLIARNERSLVKFEELSSNYNKLREEHGFLMSKLTPHMF